MAKKWHPDQNKDPSAREKFHEVQSAYEILSDPAKKQQFDQFGETAFDPSGEFNPSAGAGFAQGGFGGFDGFGGGFPGGISLDDLIFGGGSGGRRGRRGSTGEDIEVSYGRAISPAANTLTE